LAIAVLFARKIILPVRSAVSVAASIAEGNLDNTITISSKDEIGEMLEALSVMQDKLRISIEEDRRKGAETGRIKQALDESNSCVMLFDPNFDIIYTNGALVEMFSMGQADIRKELPNFDANKLLGASIDMLYKNPAEERRQLASLSGTRESEMEIGGRTYKVTVNPVTDADGQRVGTVAEWRERTQEILVEEEVNSIVFAAQAGDLSQRIAMEGKNGFQESLSSGVNNLVDMAEKVINDTSRVLSAMAKGDLTERIEAEYEGSFGKLKADATTTVEKFTEVVANIQSGSSSVETAANEIARGNMDLSQRTEEQASTLEETAASMEQMTATVKQNADNADQSNHLSSAACEQADRGGEVVGNAVEAMSLISESSKKITNIIGVIDEIAFQTNLLALNASVEAARAGEQGRGFAVVASEVRELAGRSAKAAKEIKDLIEDSSIKVEEGTQLVNESGEALKEIVESVQKVSSIVSEIAEASQEQSQGIEQVNKAVTQMDDMTQQNAAMVEEAASASDAMGQQARNLNEMMQFFTVSGSAAGGVSLAPDNETHVPDGLEKRKSGRPWGKDQNKKQNFSSELSVVKAAGTRDEQWEDF